MSAETEEKKQREAAHVAAELIALDENHLAKYSRRSDRRGLQCRHFLREAFVVGVSTLAAVALICVAVVHPALFTVLSSLVWFSLATYVSYVPLHCCATHSLSRRTRYALHGLELQASFSAVWNACCCGAACGCAAARTTR